MKSLFLVVCMAAAIGSNFSWAQPKASLAEAEEAARYCGGGGFVTTSETLTYASKATTDEYSIAGNLPDYSALADSVNCANVAGATLVGYYDRFCANLIPNYNSCMQLGSIIIYRSAGSEITSVVSKLKSYMKTSSAGTTASNFHSGMKTYAGEYNYSYSTEDLGSLNFEKYKSAVEANKPVVLFLSGYTFYSGAQTTGSGEVLTGAYCSAEHVVVGCGYKVDTYYNAAGSQLYTRTYLLVASGLDGRGVDYLCLDGKTTVDGAAAVVIS